MKFNTKYKTNRIRIAVTMQARPRGMTGMTVTNYSEILQCCSAVVFLKEFVFMRFSVLLF